MDVRGRLRLRRGTLSGRGAGRGGPSLSHAVALSRCRDWPVRQDPFSTYRSGFEVRTYRLCRRVLMFHHFPEELGDRSCLVRSTAFHYREKPIGSFIARVVQSGHRRQRRRPLSDAVAAAARSLLHARARSRIPRFHDYRLEDVDAESLANLPGGIDGADYRWLDLDGEGISGVLTEQDSAWFYKPNLGDGRFGAVETVATRPSLARAERRPPAVHGCRRRRQSRSRRSVAAGRRASTSGPSTPGWAGFRAFRSLPVHGLETIPISASSISPATASPMC